MERSRSPTLSMVCSRRMALTSCRLLVGSQIHVFGVQLFVRLTLVRIERNAINRADLLALRLAEMTDTLGTKVGVDLVDLLPLIDRAVRAFRLADIAVDAFIGNHQRHGFTP